MKIFNQSAHSHSSWVWLMFAAFLSITPFCPAQEASGVEGISLSDPKLKVELIDTHPDEFFLSHDMDLQGRLFMGSREGVFVYQRKDDGGFAPRKELYRFPKDTWVYDLESFGDDLLVLTNTALYRLADVLGSEPKLEKILWGNPLGHHHQGLHSIEFAPDGALLIVMGDPHPGIGLDKTRPDHLWQWTWYVGTENRKVPYAGVGAVMRLDLDNYDFSIYASGLRNACGISFDRDWHLFANDNDQEGSTANPCRLVYVPPHSWNGWARGWDTSQNPARLDMLPTVNWQLDVPTGQGFYDDTTLGEAYRGSLFMSNWGSRSVSWHPMKVEGAGFKSPAKPFLLADGNRRPVSAKPTNRGDLIVSLCHMAGNEGSPYRQTDLVIVSPRERTGSEDFDFSDKSLIELLSAPLQLRAKAHREILRLGGKNLEEAAQAFVGSSPDHPAFSSLIFLAAAHGDSASTDRIIGLTKESGRASTLAWRAAAAYSDKFSAISAEMVDAFAASEKSPAQLAGFLEYLHAAKHPISDSVAKLAAHSDPFVRQSAAVLLARQASETRLTELATGDSEQRLAANLATVFRLWEAAEKVTKLPEGGTETLEKHMTLHHPEGVIDMRKLEPDVGIFTLADWWRDPKVKTAHAAEFDRLQKGLTDGDDKVAIAAATGLFFLNDERANLAITGVLDRNDINFSMVAGAANKADLKKALSALKDAKLSTGVEIPEAFRDIDWDNEKKNGDIAKGKELFTQRGCVACHLAPHDGTGGAIGPSLVGGGDRFPPSYLAASILVPNLTVSPNFHPNTITMKDGTTHTGYVEIGGAPGTVKLRVITGQLVELAKDQIAKQQASEQSMMPAGLIQTPDEMRDMIAYLQVSKGKKANPKAKAKGGKTKVANNRPADLEKSDTSLLVQQAINPLRPNAFVFPAAKAKFVRIDILESSQGQPCIDELEIYSTDLPKNLAHHSTGAKASASSLLKGHAEKHQIEFLNDGRFGNERSWIPAEKTGWAQIELPEVTAIDSVILSRDRGGSLIRRVPISFDILISTDGEKWTPVKKVRPPKGGKPAAKNNQPDGKKAKVAQPLPKLDDTGFTPIFDGNTLDDWDGREGAWGIADGTISCTGKEKERNWIVWRGGEPGDFVLRLEFKYGTGNSGVQVRSDDLGDHQVFGYQVEIAPQKKMGLWHHSLLGKEDPSHGARFFMATAGQEVIIDKDGKKSAKQVAPADETVAHCNEDDWNVMEIIAEGNTLTQKINGVVFSKVSDDDTRMSRRKGFIALQDHGKGCLVAFRNIRIKELAADDKAAKSDSPVPTPTQAQKTSKPNIIVILADDLGWGDVSCNQPEKGKLKTPAIDALAAEGKRFTNAHAPHAVCTPTRYSLLTGRYCWRSFLREGVLPGYSKPLIPPTRTTIASALKGKGYTTAAFGKWHIGLGWQPVEGDPGDFHFGSHLHGPGGSKALAAVSRRVDHTAPITGGPIELGFDTFFGTPSNCSRIPIFIRDDRVINNPKRDKNGLISDPAVDRQTVDDLYVAEAGTFIKAAAQSEKPFFVYLALNAAHGAILPPDRFKGTTGIGDRGDRVPWVDESVGKVRKILAEAGVEKNTLIIFTSDNGPVYKNYEIPKHDHDGSGPYRGYKTDSWDGGTRVPFIAHWPGKIEAGTVNDNLLCLTDLLPTAAALVGAELPKWAAEDGVDQTTQLFETGAATSRESMITQSYVGLLSIREGKWKLIFDTQGSGGFYKYSAEVEEMDTLAPWRVDLSKTGQLYDLEADPYEQNNLYAENPNVVKQLTAKMRAAIVSGRSNGAEISKPRETSRPKRARRKSK